ncbi:hypothetical protein [Acinetobacter seifertii]|uniref:hypothetical protein n=1 Tax=Acinetobacter seifertii TaxID=1530123 RepID=UPI000D3D189E|nr:hypothetical protein [Acinetobacter seifertii]PTV52209.1 hypothetical protein DBL04_15135 [Acinetobacter seifertii]
MNKKISIKILFYLLLCVQSACVKREKVYIAKEGEVVTWKQNNYLIVKAKLGKRRKHIINKNCNRCERESYQPEHEHYLGQFPIDYSPEKFSLLSESEVSQLPFPYSNHQLEFNLILKDYSFEVTDTPIYSEKALDDINQVKVSINNLDSNGFTTKNGYESKLKNKNYDKEMFVKYGLYCFYTKDLGLGCFGESKNKSISGLSFTFMNNNKVMVQSWESVYGGINVQWIVDQKNLNHWREIDAAIWRLLEVWNVTPLKLK